MDGNRSAHTGAHETDKPIKNQVGVRGTAEATRKKFQSFRPTESLRGGSDGKVDTPEEFFLAQLRQGPAQSGAIAVQQGQEMAADRLLPEIAFRLEPGDQAHENHAAESRVADDTQTGGEKGPQNFFQAGISAWSRGFTGVEQFEAFLVAHPEWRPRERYEHNNGLLVISRNT